MSNQNAGEWCEECQGYRHMPWHADAYAHQERSALGHCCDECDDSDSAMVNLSTARLAHTRAIVDHAELCEQQSAIEVAFKERWANAPRHFTATIEVDDALYWYRTGRADERAEQTRIRNEDLQQIQMMRERMD